MNGDSTLAGGQARALRRLGLLLLLAPLLTVAISARQARVRPYDWREATGVAQADASEEPEREEQQRRRGAEGAPLTNAEIEALVAAERARLDAERPPSRESPFAPAEQFARDAEAIAEAAARDREADRKGASTASTVDPAADLVDAGARLARVGDEVAEKTTLVAKSVSILLFLVALLLWYTGIFTTGQFSNPVTLLGRAAVAFVLLVGSPFIMTSLESLCSGAAQAIDATFSGVDADAGASALREVYRKIGQGIEKHWEDYNAQTLRADDAAGEFVETSWRIATMFYLVLRAVWDFLWIALRIVAPFSAVAFMISADFGGRIFSAWLRNVLNVASWPIGWAIVYGLMNAGIDDWARTDPGTLYQIAFLCYTLALLVLSVPILVSLFWNGEGVSGMLTNFGAGLAGGLVRTGIAGFGGALPSLGLAGEAGGHAALEAWDQASALGGIGTRGHGSPHLGRHAHGAGSMPVPSGGSLQKGLAGLYALARGRSEIADRLLTEAGLSERPSARASVGDAPSRPTARPEPSTGAASASVGETRAGERVGEATVANADGSPPEPAHGAEAPTVRPVAHDEGSTVRFSSPAIDAVGIARRWGANVQPEDLGRNRMDPRGESVRDADGNRLHVGDYARVPSGRTDDGSATSFEGRVVGFRKNDEGHRVPVLRGHEVAEGRRIGPEQEVVMTTWPDEPGVAIEPPPQARTPEPPTTFDEPERGATGHAYI